MSVATPRLLPLRAHAQVALVVDAFPTVPATVVSTSRAAATLLLGRDTVPARMLHRRPGAVEALVDGRRFRGEGEIAMVTGRRGKVRDDTIVFHFTTGEPKLRRVHPRTPVVLPVTVVPKRAELRPANARTLDLSAGGALVRAPAALERGEELLLHLQLPTEELPIPAAGSVVRRTQDGDLGVRLDRMRPADRELVTRWIQSRAAGRSR
jgi:hypothetical protein